MGIRPVPESYPVTQSFYADLTAYNLGAGHGAIDYGAPKGTEVVATAPATVVFAGQAWDLPASSWEARYYQIRPTVGDTKTGGGKLVILDHGGYVTINAHLSKINVRTGDRVVMGQVVGEVGATGSSIGWSGVVGADDAAHLHFALLLKPFQWTNGYYGGVDPSPYIADKHFKANTYTAPDYSQSTMDGIDIASYQIGINLAKVAADFVIIKATEGTGYVNPDMARAVEQALNLGKRVGLYHFATAKADSDAEADHFVKVAGPYLKRGAIPVLDWEPIGLSSYTAWAEDWCKRVEAKTSTAPEDLMVYMNLSVSGYSWSTYMRRHPLWLAYYGDDSGFTGYATTFTPPATPGWSLALWQYTQHGTLPGYSGELDLNVAFGDPWDRPTGLGTAAKNLMDMIKEMTMAEFTTALRAALEDKQVQFLLGRAVADAFKRADARERVAEAVLTYEGPVKGLGLQHAEVTNTLTQNAYGHDRAEKTRREVLKVQDAQAEQVQQLAALTDAVRAQGELLTQALEATQPTIVDVIKEKA